MTSSLYFAGCRRILLDGLMTLLAQFILRLPQIIAPQKNGDEYIHGDDSFLWILINLVFHFLHFSSFHNNPCEGDAILTLLYFAQFSNFDDNLCEGGCRIDTVGTIHLDLSSLKTSNHYCSEKMVMVMIVIIVIILRESWKTKAKRIVFHHPHPYLCQVTFLIKSLTHISTFGNVVKRPEFYPFFCTLL